MSGMSKRIHGQNVANSVNNCHRRCNTLYLRFLHGLCNDLFDLGHYQYVGKSGATAAAIVASICAHITVCRITAGTRPLQQSPHYYRQYALLFHR